MTFQCQVFMAAIRRKQQLVFQMRKYRDSFYSTGYNCYWLFLLPPSGSHGAEGQCIRSPLMADIYKCPLIQVRQTWLHCDHCVAFDTMYMELHQTTQTLCPGLPQEPECSFVGQSADRVCVCVCVCVKVAQSCPTLWDPKDYTIHGILQARILEQVAVPFSRGSFQPRDRTQVSNPGLAHCRLMPTEINEQSKALESLLSILPQESKNYS